MLAAFGYNRDRKRGKMQIVYGLLCAADDCPVAVEVLPGNSADPSTVVTQISKIRKRFNIHNVALLGDRGMITSARIREDLLPVILDWISVLRDADIRKLFKDQTDSQIDTKLCTNELQPDQVTEIVSTEIPSERLPVCLNPRLRQERAKNANSRCAPLKPYSPRSPPPLAATNQIPPAATATLNGLDAKPTATKSKSTSTSLSPMATCCGREISSESITKLNSTASM